MKHRKDRRGAQPRERKDNTRYAARPMTIWFAKN